MSIRTRIAETSAKLRASYWFLPTLLACAGFALGVSLVLVDARLGDAWLGQYEWFYGSRPDGARSMLSTIAGSTITVAGVVFSITLAAVTYASGQFGPRLLGNFMRDRGNQSTLGVFVGTYLYCLVVLRTIRSAQEVSADSSGIVRTAFVPHLAMFGALALAVASTAVLIYFVHHVTSGIHINNVIARVGSDLIAQFRHQGSSSKAETEVPKRSRRVDLGQRFNATRTGYIETIDYDLLLTIASRDDLVLRPAGRAGGFVVEGRILFEAQAAESVCEQTWHECAAAVLIGRQRTAQQDLQFGIDELVEIAARALSPGVNDPFTAIACIDWLGAALGELARCPRPPTELTDDQGIVRVLLRPLQFEDYLAAAFGQLRHYLAADPNARARALHTLADLASQVEDGSQRALIEDERARLKAVEPKP